MLSRFFLSTVVVGLSFNAIAATGSGSSSVTPLETVSPTLQSAAAVTDHSLSAAFSEPMLAPGSTTPGSYAVSGMGTGSLLPSPTGVSGGPVVFTLDWAAGEMRNGVSLTLTASGMQDALGNPINPATNNVSLTGKGTAPVFSDLTVMPPEAVVGDTVTISFTASETMAEGLEVTINGRPANAPYGKAEGYIFEYEVSEYDPLGMAMIHISGADQAGNLGSMSNNEALEIIQDVEGLPLPGWPWAALLLLALGAFIGSRQEKMGLFPPRTSKRLNRPLHLYALSGPKNTSLPRGGNCPAFFGPVCQARKNRGLTQAKRNGDASVPGFCPLNTARKKFGTASGAFQSLVQRLKSLRAPGVVPFFALLLACSSAFAEDPAVTNVVMTQSPNATSTQVDIYYDLVAPNGPCSISASLSKDGGTDGYPYPVTSITGDIANVTTGTGKHLVWELRTDYPEEDLPLARIQITADDGAVLAEYYRDEDTDGWGREYTYLSGICYDSVWAAAPVYPYTATLCGDCDDTDPDIYPGAPEICNGLDDDCDGATDEDFDLQTDPLHCGFCGNECPSGVCSGGACVPLVQYFRDDDHDTWGLDLDSVWAVSPAAPYTATHGEDCDDTDPDINPGRTEICCNGKDDDCDGMTDNPTQCTFNVPYLAGAGGSISGTTPQDLYNCATGSEVTAVPDTGYHFVDWSDGLSTAARTDGNLTADLTVTANFAVNTYTLTYTADANGSISGDTPQTVNYGGSGTPVTAVPNGGYVFSQWSDGVLTDTRTDTNVTADITAMASFMLPTPEVTSFAINGGAESTTDLVVMLNNIATNSPTDYMASESPDFVGATWQPYATAPSFALSFGVGTRTVYFKARNGDGESGVVSNTIFIVPNTVSVDAGTFIMGRTAAGDDATYGYTFEDPQHSVTLSAYQFGKYEVTNKEYCDVLNWARAQGYLKTSSGAAWTGAGDIYAGDTGALYIIVVLTQATCNIQYSGGVFSSKTRVGLPGTTNYSMDMHPMVRVSWYGSVAFCNWLSQWQGLTPCYDMATALWPLTVAPPTSGGYRLPTEAEWERAAAWDASVAKHWIYSFMSDTNPNFATNRCNDFNNGTMYDNPLGLTTTPYTSPVGWYNGVNVNPRDGITTMNSPSPVGAYDLIGNVWEWTHDWYSGTYYSGGSMTNPTGPATGTGHIGRGGCWSYEFYNCRSAFRLNFSPGGTYNAIGFRIARSEPTVGMTSFVINNDDETTMPLSVTLNNVATNSPTDYMASESSDFSGASWQPYDAAPSFTLSFGVGMRTVYFKVRNGFSESSVISDTIFIVPNTVSVGAGTFTMGRTAAGDDATWGSPNEDPQHSVTLSAYQFGKYKVTNKEYCDVLNWAMAQGYLYSDTAGTPWAGTGDIYAGNAAGARYLAVSFGYSNIQYSGGVFRSKTKVGLPGSTNYSMDTHPMVNVSWYGAVAYCNWLSQWQSLTPCYNMGAANWPLTIAPPTSGGYRLPTEAEWERAAAWDGTKHWIYGFLSDSNPSQTRDRCNDMNTGGPFPYDNPLGLTEQPYTSPVGWFNGVNVSPNWNVQTVDSPSPVGAYDMSGNVNEWVHDWYGTYSSGAQTNPTGPGTGLYRIPRAGCWGDYFYYCRSAWRNAYRSPTSTSVGIGFRIATSN